MKWFQTAILSVTLFSMMGCSAIEQGDEQQWSAPPLAISLQPTLHQQVQIARLSQFLLRPEIDDKTRAKMFFERGNYYDSVGLRDLARVDFEQSLSLNPIQPDIFNLLGVYFTESADFDSAYDAFDAALELDSDNIYARRNRAIALYYGGRESLALEDMRRQYQLSDHDPFSALWLYIIESEVDKQQAQQYLRHSYQQHTQEWGWVLVGVMLNEVSDEEALRIVIQDSPNNLTLAQRLTEAYFYIAKRNQQEGNYATAISLYKLALSFNVYNYVEHRYVLLELERAFHDYQKEQQDNTLSQQM